MLFSARRLSCRNKYRCIIGRIAIWLRLGDGLRLLERLCLRNRLRLLERLYLRNGLRLPERLCLRNGLRLLRKCRNRLRVFQLGNFHGRQILNGVERGDFSLFRLQIVVVHYIILPFK